MAAWHVFLPFFVHFLMTSDDLQVPQDMQEGSLWLEKAAEQGLHEAQYFYAATFGPKGPRMRMSIESMTAVRRFTL